MSPDKVTGSLASDVIEQCAWLSESQLCCSPQIALGSATSRLFEAVRKPFALLPAFVFEPDQGL